MKFLLVVSWLIFIPHAIGQVEHAPTVAQCQADQRLWLSNVEQGDSPILPTFRILNEWAKEMGNCEKVDPSGISKYYNLESEIMAIQFSRLMDFIQHHQMIDQFVKEDAAGKR